MEFFRDAYSVRLMGHTGKYLWADEDKKTVAQRRGKDTYGVIWRVEVVPDRNAIRLKSVYDLYLMASDYAFLLGATGKRVLQSFASKADSSLEWEPVAEGTYVKLKTKGDKFLRANGGLPPYRNSITHDVPMLASNQQVILWEVDVVRKRDVSKDSMPSSRMSPRQSNVSAPSPAPSAPPAPQPQTETSDDDEIPPPPPVNVRKPRPRSAPIPQLEVETSEEDIPPPPPPPVSVHRPRPRAYPPPRRHHYDDDDYNYSPMSSEQASPTYPPPRRRNPPASPPTESLRATHITRRRGSESEATSYDYSPPPRRRAAREEPEYDHSPPPRRRAEARYDQSPPPRRRPARDRDYGSSASETSSPGHVYHHRHAPVPAPVPAPPRRGRREEYEYEEAEEVASVDEGSTRSGGGGSSRGKESGDMRRIFYSVAEEDGEVLAYDEETYGTFMFKGQSVDELTRELQRVTGIHEDIILCMRNPLSAKLYKMRLALPQNNAPLSVVIVRSGSPFGRTFSTQSRQ